MLHSSQFKELQNTDISILDLLQKEEQRQFNGLEMIASENYCSKAIMEAQGSILTNKYAEGYPKKRYYDGCEVVDLIEQLAIDRLKNLYSTNEFLVPYANVQPHSGSSANIAAYAAVAVPGDKMLGMDLSQGGHLTHGSPVNFSGKLYQFTHYGLDPKTELIDYNQVEELAKTHRPKVIVAGASSYPRIINFQYFGEIAKKYNALLIVDMAHIAGLVAAGLHPSPLGIADIVTSTTHKTLRGPRGGIILAKTEWEKAINSAVFPGSQGGPLEHVIAAKAVCFHEAQNPNFKEYQKQVLLNCKELAKTLMSEGIELVTGGTENHLLLLKTTNLGISGKEGSEALEKAHITCNKNMIPGDQRSPFVTSGLRLGTAALTTRGLKENEMKQIGLWVAGLLKRSKETPFIEEVKNQVIELCKQFPLYQ